MAYSYASNPSEAEDIAQDALLRAWRRRSTLREADRRNQWLATIVRNEAFRRHARIRPDPAGTDLAPRTLSERRAAALVEMAAESLRRSSPGGRAPVGVDVIIDVDTLRGEPAADLTKIRCELGSGAPITAATALRLCCDASVGRVVMHGPSEVLDLGRRTRVVSHAQRRALVCS